jgi:hypothetical protein
MSSQKKKQDDAALGAARDARGVKSATLLEDESLDVTFSNCLRLQWRAC